MDDDFERAYQKKLRLVRDEEDLKVRDNMDTAREIRRLEVEKIQGAREDVAREMARLREEMDEEQEWKPYLMGEKAQAKMREFDTGASRDSDEDKLDYEGFLSPLVLEEFANYMHKNRIQSDGSVRDSDNWQKGIPLDAYMKSGFRHFVDWWSAHRGGGQDVVEALCALIFNAQGYLHELLKEEHGPDSD